MINSYTADPLVCTPNSGFLWSDPRRSPAIRQDATLNKRFLWSDPETILMYERREDGREAFR